MSRYRASAMVYSGRPDPTWSLDDDAAKDILALWDELEPYDGEPAAAPPLGYRGCSLHGPSGAEFVSYGGYVTRVAKGVSETRVDADRRFEASLIATAPHDALPPGFKLD